MRRTALVIGLIACFILLGLPLITVAGSATFLKSLPQANPQDTGSISQDTGSVSQDKSSGKTAETPISDEQKELYSKLETYLTGAKLKGRFTIVGRDLPAQDEEYTISKASKLPEGDLWLIESRIKYGKWDQVVPLTLNIKWADKTPVITLEKFTIPTMGTFSARVLFNNGMYSGTWAHDEVKGHMFGEVIPADATQTTENSEEASTPPTKESAAPTDK